MEIIKSQKFKLTLLKVSFLIPIALLIILPFFLVAYSQYIYSRLKLEGILIPYVVFIPLGAWIAQMYGMSKLFLVMGVVLVGVVTPLYFFMQVKLGKKVA